MKATSLPGGGDGGGRQRCRRRPAGRDRLRRQHAAGWDRRRSSRRAAGGVDDANGRLPNGIDGEDNKLQNCRDDGLAIDNGWRGCLIKPTK